MVEKRVMKRRSAPVDEDEAPTRSTKPVKKAAAKKSASPRRQPADDNGEEAQLRSGWSAAQETIDATSPWAANFKPTNNLQVVKFLQAAPYASYRNHWLDRVGVGRRPYVCLESVNRLCPLCGIGHRASAVAAFNIAVVGDDGEAVLKSWDCGVKVTQMLKTFNNDPKIGPLEKAAIYFGVSVSEANQRQQKQTMVVPIRARDLPEDYQIEPLDDDTIERLLRKAYTNDIIAIPRVSELEEIAAEMLDEDATAGTGWS